jgi:hypothetical protein
MKPIQLVVAAAVLAVAPLSAQTPAPAAQAPATPATMVLSNNKCASANLAQLRAVTDSMLGPVLDELVREGKLAGWGVLTHAWGDEWNWNIYYTAQTIQAFHDAFTQFVARVNQRYPGTFARLISMCTEHRDNIYNVTHMRGRP